VTFIAPAETEPVPVDTNPTIPSGAGIFLNYDEFRPNDQKKDSINVINEAIKFTSPEPG
jgi:hypothetical protein